jgi:hypothetical protein
MKAKEAAEIARADDLVEQMKDLQTKTLNVLASAELGRLTGRSEERQLGGVICMRLLQEDEARWLTRGRRIGSRRRCG